MCIRYYGYYQRIITVIVIARAWVSSLSHAQRGKSCVPVSSPCRWNELFLKTGGFFRVKRGASNTYVGVVRRAFYVCFFFFFTFIPTNRVKRDFLLLTVFFKIVFQQLSITFRVLSGCNYYFFLIFKIIIAYTVFFAIVVHVFSAFSSGFILLRFHDWKLTCITFSSSKNHQSAAYVKSDVALCVRCACLYR